MLQGDVTASLIVGGRSNLTYDVSMGQRRFVVRRPPLGHVLATAHDMTREHTVLRALADTRVPVPEVVAVCTDRTVLGAPFYVMEFVTGSVFRYADELATLGAARTRSIAMAMVDALVSLHCVAPQDVGLSEFGRPTGFLWRQVRRWRRQLDESHTRPLPKADILYELLLRAMPVDLRASAPPRLVHGDYRLDNLLVDEQDAVSAIVDWEMATLGDPMTDVALLLIYGRLATIPSGRAITDVANAAGYPTEDEILARYARATGADLSDLSFYLGMQAFKLAAILEGIHCRHLAGQTVGPGFELAGAATDAALDLGINALEEHL